MTTSPAPLPPAAQMAPISRSNRPTIVGPPQPESPYPIQLEGIVSKGFGRGARFLGIPTANLPDSSLGPLNELQLTGIYYGFARVHPSLTTPLPTALPTPTSTPTTTSYPFPSSSTSTSASTTSNPSTSTPSTSAQSLSPDQTSPLNPDDTPTSSQTQKPPKSGPLSPESLLALPAQTAPYPPDSIQGVEAGRKRLEGDDGQVWPMVMSVGWNPYFKNEKITAEVHIMHPFAHDFYGHQMSVLVLGYIRPELDYVSREALIDDIQFDVKVALNSLARPPYASYATDKFLTG